MLLYHVNRINYYYYQVYGYFVNDHTYCMVYMIKPDIIISNKYNVGNRIYDLCWGESVSMCLQQK